MWLTAFLSSLILLQAYMNGGFETAFQRAHGVAFLSRHHLEPSQGRFLVATRTLIDPRFREKVVLLVHHDEQAVVGLIINHPTKVPLSHAFPDRKMTKRKEESVHIGGPVNLKQVFWLIRMSNSLEDERGMPKMRKVFSNIYLGSHEERLETAIEELKPYEDLRVYMGYAGWTVNQLQNEIDSGHWLVWDADPALIFDFDSSKVWQEMIRRTTVMQALGNLLP